MKRLRTYDFNDVTRDLNTEQDGLNVNLRPTETSADVPCPSCGESTKVVIPLGKGRYEYVEWARYLSEFKQFHRCRCGHSFRIRQTIQVYAEDIPKVVEEGLVSKGAETVAEMQSVKFACHQTHSWRSVPRECVFDNGIHSECSLAMDLVRDKKSQESCLHWKPVNELKLLGEEDGKEEKLILPSVSEGTDSSEH